MEIIHENTERKGVFIAKEGDRKAGEMTYSQAGPDKIIIDHTEVNPEFKGKGVGKELVYAAVAYAREHNLKIMPLCPFAKATFDKNKELQDVLF